MPHDQITTPAQPSERVTVKGEATVTNGARWRVLDTDDGRQWVVSAYRGAYLPEGETLVMLMQDDGELRADAVIELDGVRMDEAQAQFIAAYKAGTLREPTQHTPEAPKGGVASQEAVEALRAAVCGPRRHLRAIPPR